MQYADPNDVVVGGCVLLRLCGRHGLGCCCDDDDDEGVVAVKSDTIFDLS